MEENNKKIRRVGTFTLAFALIVFGIVMILRMFLRFDSLRYILMLWPVVFISLGVEILAFSAKKDAYIKFDGVSILLVFLIIGISCIFGVLNFGINEFLYNNSIKQSLIERNSHNTYDILYKDQININNLSDTKIKVQIEELNLENKSGKRNAVITTSSNYNEQKISIIDLLDSDAEDDIFMIDMPSDNSVVNILITYIPNYINDYTIKIVIPDKEKIKLNGNFEIL